MITLKSAEQQEEPSEKEEKENASGHAATVSGWIIVLELGK